MKNKNAVKKFISLVLGLVMVLGLAMPVMAQSTELHTWDNTTTFQWNHTTVGDVTYFGEGMGDEIERADFSITNIFDTGSVRRPVISDGEHIAYTLDNVVYAHAPAVITILPGYPVRSWGNTFFRIDAPNPDLPFDGTRHALATATGTTTRDEYGWRTSTGETYVLTPGIYVTFGQWDGSTLFIVVLGDDDTPSQPSGAYIVVNDGDGGLLITLNAQPIESLQGTQHEDFRIMRSYIVEAGTTLNIVNAPAFEHLVSIHNFNEFDGYRFPSEVLNSERITNTFVFNVTGVFVIQIYEESPDGLSTRAFKFEVRERTTTPPTTTAPNLNTASTWAHEGINNAVAAGLVPQSLQNHYTNNITRAEFTALAVLLYEAATGREITGRVTFNDTNDINVEKAAYIGIVSGTGNNNFSPNMQFNREQAAVILSRLADAIGQPLPQIAAAFADNAQISSWAMESVGQVQAADIMGGVGNNIFSPHGTFTREQSIITILRLFEFLS